MPETNQGTSTGGLKIPIPAEVLKGSPAWVKALVVVLPFLSALIGIGELRARVDTTNEKIAALESAHKERNAKVDALLEKMDQRITDTERRTVDKLDDVRKMVDKANIKLALICAKVRCSSASETESE